MWWAIGKLTKVHERQDEKEIKRKSHKRVNCVRTDGPYRISLSEYKKTYRFKNQTNPKHIISSNKWGKNHMQFNNSKPLKLPKQSKYSRRKFCHHRHIWTTFYICLEIIGLRYIKSKGNTQKFRIIYSYWYCCERCDVIIWYKNKNTINPYWYFFLIT